MIIQNAMPAIALGVCCLMFMAQAPRRPVPLQPPAGPPPFDERGRPNRNRPGPWDHDVLVYRVGPDGRLQRLAIFERAGVPTATRVRDGRLVIAHQHFPADNDADFDKVAVRFSSDEGRTWTAPRVIRVQGLPPGMRFPFDPTLVTLPDGRVRLYFTGLMGRTFQQDRPRIYSAVSTNAVDYIFEPGERFGIEGRPVIDCAVLLHEGTFHLYAPDNGELFPPPVSRPGFPRAPRRQPGPAPPETRPREGAAYHATSEDGLRFTRQPDVFIGGRRRWLGNAQSDGEVVRFFGTGDAGPRRPAKVWSATSRDGRHWAIDPGFAGPPVADPAAVKLRDGSWLIAGTGPPRTGRAR